MASILEALLGTESEQDYLAKDPYYSAGVNIARTPMPQARTSAEAFFMPVVQGLISGGLAGYGQNRAKETEYDDIKSALRSSPGYVESSDPLRSYSTEDAPEGWTSSIGKRDRILSALSMQQSQDLEQEEAKNAAAIRKALAEKGMGVTPEGAVARIRGFGEASAAIAGAETFANEKAKADAAKEGGMTVKDLPATMIQSLANSKAVVDEARTIANALDSSGDTWADVQAAKAFGGLDTAGIALQLRNLGDKLGRARTGAAMSEAEQKLYERLMGGDLSVTPKQTAMLLRKLAEAESRMAVSQISTIESASGGLGNLKASFAVPKRSSSGPAIPEGATPTGRTTTKGKPTYIMNGIEGVIE